MEPFIPVATAKESEQDERTVVHDMAMPIIYTKGGYDYINHENQAKVGICTSISHIQLVEKVIGKKFSSEFQYLLQKKFIDGDWQEGSSIFSSLKVGKKYGYLPIDKFTYVTEADRNLPYEQYIAKLQAIPDSEITRLLSLCEFHLTGYAQVDISSKENVSHAINSSAGGILCRYTINNRWWTDSLGNITWDSSKIDPLNPNGNTVGGHAIIMSAFDYTQGSNQVLSNTWGNFWNVQGNADINFDNYKPTECWIPYFGIIPTQPITQFTLNLQLGSTGSEVKLLQQTLKNLKFFPQGQSTTSYFGQVTRTAVIAFQKKYGIQQTGTVGTLTRAMLSKVINNQSTTMTPQSKIELTSIAHTFIAVLGATVMANINTLDIHNLSKGTLLAFGIAILRSVVKTMYNVYFPQNEPKTS